MTYDESLIRFLLQITIGLIASLAIIAAGMSLYCVWQIYQIKKRFYK